VAQSIDSVATIDPNGSPESPARDLEAIITDRRKVRLCANLEHLGGLAGSQIPDVRRTSASGYRKELSTPPHRSDCSHMMRSGKQGVEQAVW
jgi:hypothetical protein